MVFVSNSGDDGQGKEATSGILMKESENIYALWCSGRVCVEGMLVELKLLKRQDLINVMANLFKPCVDQIVSSLMNCCLGFILPKSFIVIKDSSLPIKYEISFIKSIGSIKPFLYLSQV